MHWQWFDNDFFVHDNNLDLLEIRPILSSGSSLWLFGMGFCLPLSYEIFQFITTLDVLFNKVMLTLFCLSPQISSASCMNKNVIFFFEVYSGALPNMVHLFVYLQRSGGIFFPIELLGASCKNIFYTWGIKSYKSLHHYHTT